MEEIGMVLCVHGEVTDPDVDVFDREAVFIERVLTPLIGVSPTENRVRAYHHRRCRKLRRTGRRRMSPPQSPRSTSSSTATRSLPVVFVHMLIACRSPSARQHRLAVRRAATSGSTKFFLGTDSAPHSREAKESACGCAGIFNAPFALESYATVFEEEGALDRLEGFASTNGAHFYGLPTERTER